MSILGLIGSAFSSILGKSALETILSAGKSWWQNREEMKLIKEKQALELQAAGHQAKLAKIERDSKLYADADVESIRSWKDSWMDEVYKLVVLGLFVAPFTPAAPYILEGANTLAAYPLWVQLIIAGTFISVLGLRFLLLAPLKVLFPKKFQ